MAVAKIASSLPRLERPARAARAFLVFGSPARPTRPASWRPRLERSSLTTRGPMSPLNVTGSTEAHLLKASRGRISSYERITARAKTLWLFQHNASYHTSLVHKGATSEPFDRHLA